MSFATTDQRDRRSRLWPRLRRGAFAAFLLGVVALIYLQARKIDWPEVFRAMGRFDAKQLGLAALAAAGSYALLAVFDLFARPATRGKLSTPMALAVPFICYVFNFNLGAWVGSIGFRYRLYSRFGVPTGDITRMIGLGFLTNWCGFFVIGGVAFLLRVVALPPEMKLGPIGESIGGAVLLALACGYLLASAFARRRSWTWRGKTLELHSGRFALAQLAVSSVNWLLMAATIAPLLAAHFDFATVLGVFLVAAIAVLAAHIPAGLGVTEAVFFAMLGQRIPGSELLAALLTYRAIYFFAPFLLALPLYIAIETRVRHRIAVVS